jgi:nonsense-mediated mRNA decay protein 3
MKFCFLCGKRTEKLIKGYCEECYKKKFQLIEVPEEIPITLCVRCRNIKERHKWTENEIDKVLRDRIKVLGKDVSIRIEKNEEDAKIIAKGLLEFSKSPKEEVHEVKLKIKKVTCPTCSRKAGKYYESTIQIRGNLTNDDVDAIDDDVLERGGFYRVKEVKGGYDFFISDKSLAKKIVETFKTRHKVEIKKSFKLLTRRDGKDIYRDTILLRIESD